ncbi:hypothetical protein BpHYR1_047322, partial [Brachionus plicatilis]
MSKYSKKLDFRLPNISRNFWLTDIYIINFDNVAEIPTKFNVKIALQEVNYKQKIETSCRYLVFIVVGNFWPLVLFCTFWSLEVVGDWTLANNQSQQLPKTI